MNRVKLVVIVVVLMLVVVVMAVNWTSVEVDFLLAKVAMPMPILLVITLLIGFAVGALAPWRWMLTVRKKGKG